MSATRWPGGVLDGAGEEWGKPIEQMLTKLKVLEDPDDKVELFQETPASLQVITAGATAIARRWTAVLAVFGGGPAVLAGLRGLGLLPGATPTGELERPVFMLAASIAIAAVAVAIAVIIRADVQARAMASAAQYAARAEITGTLLTTIGLAAPPCSTPVALVEGKLRRVDKVELDKNRKELVAYVDGRKMRAYDLDDLYDLNGASRNGSS